MMQLLDPYIISIRLKERLDRSSSVDRRIVNVTGGILTTFILKVRASRILLDKVLDLHNELLRYPTCIYHCNHTCIYHCNHTCIYHCNEATLDEATSA